MSQVTADGLPEDGCLGLIPTHPCLQPIHLQPQKDSQGQKQMTQNLSSDSCANKPGIGASPAIRNPVDSTHNQRAGMRCEEPAPRILQMGGQSFAHTASENLSRQR